MFAKLPDPACVWTGRRLANEFEVDHVLPYCLWHNNELWNFLPASRQANNQKRDRLPTRELLVTRQAVVFRYWAALHSALPQRFAREAGRVLGRAYENPAELMSAVIEAVETTALQRGVERWAPSSSPIRD